MNFRKYLVFSIFLMFTATCAGQDIITVNGKIPIVISAPHGGNKESLSIKNRTSGVTSTDSYTIELAKDIQNELYYLLGKQAGLIYCSRKRTEIDLNRPVDDSFEDDKLERIWYQYHFEIQRELIKHIWSDSIILYLDIHGQNHKHEVLEIGFDTRSYSEKELLFGNLFSAQGIDCYPASNRIEPTPYFDGGYCIETYKHYPNVVAVQLEVPLKFRKSNKKRKEFAKKTARVIYEYYAVLQQN